MKENKVNSVDYLGQIVEVTMDRPLGSKHPKHGFIYEANYGYIAGTTNSDGEELDAYFLDIDGSRQKAIGKCIAVIHRLNDDDDKLVVIPEDIIDLSDEEIRRQTNFQEQFFKSVIVR